MKIKLFLYVCCLLVLVAIAGCAGLQDDAGRDNAGAYKSPSGGSCH